MDRRDLAKECHSCLRPVYEHELVNQTLGLVLLCPTEGRSQ